MTIVVENNNDNDNENNEDNKIKIKDKYKNFTPEQTPSQYQAMKEDIKENGQKMPGVINQDGILVDGHHRYRACHELGIPFQYYVEYFDNELEELRYIRQANDKRRHYTKFQSIEQELKWKDELAQRAKENMSLAGREKKAFTNIGRPSINVQEEIAKNSDSSKGSVSKVEQIMRSPLFRENEEFREKCRLDKMSIDHAHTMVKQLEERDKPKPAPPEGHYNVILVDPPWSYIVPGRCDPKNHYGVMSDEEIKAFKVPAADNTILFLWATNPKLDIAIDILRAWGFTYKTNFAWFKDKFGTGYYNRGQHELLLIAVKGDGIGVPYQGDRLPSVFFAERTEHSKKPDIVYEMIEKMYPGRKRIELFARGKPRDGWAVWGLEAAVVVDEVEKEENKEEVTI
jgi:N6-adenosine-specific RNA methylase IME4/ParB-like chromosome segregation protein Spo0J